MHYPPSHVTRSSRENPVTDPNPPEGPIRAGVGVGNDLLLAAAVGAHDINAPTAGAGAAEHNAAVGRPGRECIGASGVGQAADVASVHVHHIYVYIAA